MFVGLASMLSISARGGKVTTPGCLLLTPCFSGVFVSDETSQPLQRFVHAMKPLKRLQSLRFVTTQLKQGVSEI